MHLLIVGRLTALECAVVGTVGKPRWPAYACGIAYSRAETEVDGRIPKRSQVPLTSGRAVARQYSDDCSVAANRLAIGPGRSLEFHAPDAQAYAVLYESRRSARYRESI